MTQYNAHNEWLDQQFTHEEETTMPAVVNTYHDHPKRRRTRRIPLIARLGIPLAMLASISLGALHADAASLPTTVSWLVPTTPGVAPACSQMLLQVGVVTYDSGTPTGTVTFSDEDGNLATAPMVGHFASATVSLPVGYHTISAMYSGDSSYAASYAASISETISACTTTTSVLLAGPQNPQSQSLSLVVKVSNTGSTAPTGQIQLLDYGRPLGPRHTLGTAPNGQTEVLVPLSGLSLGGHAFTAQYYGDAADYGSTSAPVPWFIL